jgi:uncharacterized protein YdaU (DUF1376 family)
MNKPPAFQFYVKDWRSSPTIRSMAREEKGDAIDSMAASWDQDEPGTLPLPEERAAKICGISVRSFKKFRRSFPNFWQIDGNRLVNPKLRAQWEELRQLKKKQSDAARKTNEEYWKRPPVSDAVSESVTAPSAPAPALAPASTKHMLAGNRSRMRAKPNRAEDDLLLATFWADYPRKIRRKETEVTWRRLSEAERLAAVEALTVFNASDAWQEQAGKFIPAPDRFLREGRWKTPPSKGGSNANATRKQTNAVHSRRGTDFSAGRTVLPEL